MRFAVKPTCAALSPDGTRAVVGFGRTGGGTIPVPCWVLKIWDTKSGKELRTLAGHPDHAPGVTFVAFLPGGRRILSAGHDNTIRIWDVETGKELRSFPIYDGGGRNAALSGDGNRLLEAGGRRLTLWDVETGNFLKDFSALVNPVYGLSLSADGKRAILECMPMQIGDEVDKTTQAYLDVEHGKVLWRLIPEKTKEGAGSFPSGFELAGFAPDNRSMLIRKRQEETSWLAMVERDGFKEIRKIGVPTHSGQVRLAHVTAFSADGKWLFTVDSPRKIHCFDTQNGRELAEFARPSWDLIEATFTPAGDLALVVTGTDVRNRATIRLELLNPRNGTLIRTLDPPTFERP